MTQVKFLQYFPPGVNGFEVGKSKYFDLDAWVKCIEMQINSDEIEKALWMCDNLPGWWRDKKIPEIEEIKSSLLKRTFDIFAYSNYEDLNKPPEETAMGIHAQSCFPRADICAEMVKKYNDEGIVPFIYEIGPCSGWLPLGMKKLGLKFDYFAKSLNDKAIDYLKLHAPWKDRPDEGQKTMFVCFEILEHLKDPMDIYHYYVRSDITFDNFLISTPRYTWDFEGKVWREMHLGHLRTWTPSEFIDFTAKTFKNYSWTFYDSFGMVMKGERT